MQPYAGGPPACTALPTARAPMPRNARGGPRIRCPLCQRVHLGRLRPGADPRGGRRRTPCGMVWVVVRRRYGARAEAAA